MEKLKKILLYAGVAVFLVIFGFWMWQSDLEHIEDLNGPDNYTLQQINDYNIINMDTGALNLVESKELFNNLPTFKSDKYTGVSEIFMENIIGNRLEITLYNTTVNKGNFKIVLIYNDEIVHEFRLNELMQTYTLQDINGTVALRIAGESADFKFSYSII